MNTLTTSTPPTVDNGEILSILVKNSVPLFLSLHFWDHHFDRVPELTSNKDSTAAHQVCPSASMLFFKRGD